MGEHSQVRKHIWWEAQHVREHSHVGKHSQLGNTTWRGAGHPTNHGHMLTEGWPLPWHRGQAPSPRPKVFSIRDGTITSPRHWFSGLRLGSIKHLNERNSEDLRVAKCLTGSVMSYRGSHRNWGVGSRIVSAMLGTHFLWQERLVVAQTVGDTRR